MDNLIEKYLNSSNQIERYNILNQKYEILMHFKNYTETINKLIE